MHFAFALTPSSIQQALSNRGFTQVTIFTTPYVPLSRASSTRTLTPFDFPSYHCTPVARARRLTTVLVSRLLLNLQEASRRTVRLGSGPERSLCVSDLTQTSPTLAFGERVMGSIGCTLEPEDLFSLRVEEDDEWEREGRVGEDEHTHGERGEVGMETETGSPTACGTSPTSSSGSDSDFQSRSASGSGTAQSSPVTEITMV